jgi:hypothetical protein
MVWPEGRANAACTVPNSISNGQVADATAVMGNFNALNNCVNNAVSPSGLPATSGSLPVFTSPNTIAVGNISGDCTTSGTLALTCTKSNGAPLSYFATGTDASQLTGTISVNRFNNGISADSTHFLRGDGIWATPPGAGGSGGGGGNWWGGYAPLAANFPTLVHGGAAQDVTLADDSNVGLTLDSGAFASGENVRFALQAAPASTADWKVTARITPNLWPLNYNGIGLVLYESSSTKSVISGFWFNAGALFRVRRQTNSGFLSDTYAAQHLTGNEPFWVRIRYVNSSATYFFDVSLDGKMWQSATSLTKSVLFTTAPDKVGLGFYVNNGTTTNSAKASCDYFLIES